MLTYHAMDAPPVGEWLELLNSDRVRKHLFEHASFTASSLENWLQSKIEEDKKPGCRLRAIHSEGRLAGWCGIQHESGDYAIALVLSPQYWGQGQQVMQQIRQWARELGHRHLLAQLPQTRPQIRALVRLFGEAVGSEMIQHQPFNTYRIEI